MDQVVAIYSPPRALLLLPSGAPLPAVMRLGGWRKLSTVQRYTYMNDAVAAEVHAKTSPLASPSARAL